MDNSVSMIEFLTQEQYQQKVEAMIADIQSELLQLNGSALSILAMGIFVTNNGLTVANTFYSPMP